MRHPLHQLDSKEVRLPETLFIHDIDSKVFQSIVLHCLLKLDGIEPLEGNIIDHFLGREGTDHLRGIFIEQDQKKHAVNIRIEMNVLYGICLPEKALQVQSLIAREVSSLTGLHVGSIHVVFKNVILPKEGGMFKDGHHDIKNPTDLADTF